MQVRRRVHLPQRGSTRGLRSPAHVRCLARTEPPEGKAATLLAVCCSATLQMQGSMKYGNGGTTSAARCSCPEFSLRESFPRLPHLPGFDHALDRCPDQSGWLNPYHPVSKGCLE